MSIVKILGIITLFLTGLFSGLYLASASQPEWQDGASGDSTQFADAIALNIFNPFTGITPKESPMDRIPENAILVNRDRVVLDIKGAQWATFTDTHSMEPVITAGSNAIELVPQSSDDIKVGDIVSYKSEYAQGFIIHRVVYKGVDEDGVYFIMKGDNIQTSDPGRIRFSQIQRVVVAIIY